MRFLYLKQWHGVSQLIPYKAESISGKSSAHQYAAVTIREAYEDVTVDPAVYLVIGGRLRHRAGDNGTRSDSAGDQPVGCS